MFGCKIFLQLQARYNPDIAVSKLSKVTVLYSPVLSRGGVWAIYDSLSRLVCNDVTIVIR